MQLDELNVPELEKESDALPKDDGLPVADSLVEREDDEVRTVPDAEVVVNDVTLSAPVFVVVVLAVMVRV